MSKKCKAKRGSYQGLIQKICTRQRKHGEASQRAAGDRSAKLDLGSPILAQQTASGLLQWALQLQPHDHL